MSFFLFNLFPVPTDAFEIKFSGDGPVSHVMKADPEKVGQYNVEYTPAKSGNYKIDIIFYEKSVVPKPYDAKCTGTKAKKFG